MSETTKNTLYQLEEKMNREHWGDIQLFEEEDNRYSIAVEKAILLIKELEKYRAIGSVEEFKALKEKQIAKKPLGEYTQCKCSVCGRRVRSGRGSSSFVRDNFCQRCGQAIDWE